MYTDMTTAYSVSISDDPAYFNAFYHDVVVHDEPAADLLHDGVRYAEAVLEVGGDGAVRCSC